uniref:Uncharacterized protein n=1 Tax=viral metagenome TaxID=1070528 RepID=A0A6M3ISG6_9ZZZZ
MAAHEEYHLYDTAENWVYREFRATAFLDWRVFPGFIGACLMSLTPARLGLVCRRIRGRRWRNSRQGRVE